MAGAAITPDALSIPARPFGRVPTLFVLSTSRHPPLPPHGAVGVAPFNSRDRGGGLDSVTGACVPGHMPVTPPLHVDWEAVRLEYETTTVTLEALCARHGIRWKTTLVRRKARDGWRRQVGHIAARLTVLHVAGLSEDGSPAPETEAILGAPGATDGVTPSSPAAAPRAPRKRTPPPASPSAPPPPAPDPPSADVPFAPPGAAHPEDAIITSRAIARLHADKIKRQLEVAESIKGVALELLNQIGGYLALPLDDDSDQMRDQLQRRVSRLFGAAPDRETLAGLLKCAADVAHKAVLIERHALGMDVVKEPTTEPTGPLPSSLGGSKAARLIEHLDAAVAMQLRDVAARLERDRGLPRVIDAEAR